MEVTVLPTRIYHSPTSYQLKFNSKRENCNARFCGQYIKSIINYNRKYLRTFSTVCDTADELYIKCKPYKNINASRLQVRPERHKVTIRSESERTSGSKGSGSISTADVGLANPPSFSDSRSGIGKKQNTEPVHEKKATDVYPAWFHSVEEVANYHGVDLKTGLKDDDVERQRELYGRNELERPMATSFWELIKEQLDDALVRILIAAAGVSFALAVANASDWAALSLEEFTEPLVIIAIVVLNAIIGIWQENKAESSLEALKKMQAESVWVVRGGREPAEISATELVPGDLVEVRAGDKVAADIRVAKLRSGSVRLMQASLTGESQPVQKQTQAVGKEDVDLQGKDCMAFAGTMVATGTMVGVVNQTGMLTEIGKIQSQISEASMEKYDSPLSRKLDEFSSLLTKVVGVVCILVWAVNYKYFLSWDPATGFPGNFQFSLEQATYYFKVAVALAVAAIPEGLPAVITTCLALGTRRMAEENAIVRKLPSVETLGCTTVICSDKTGTLTTNQMAVCQLVAPGDTDGELRRYTVRGTTYSPLDGSVEGLVGLPKSLQTLAEICALCNDASIVLKEGVFTASGMPTEAALKVLVEKLGVGETELQEEVEVNRLRNPKISMLGACKFWESRHKKLFTLEFDRQRKAMSVIVKEDNMSILDTWKGNKLLLKGAAEFVLAKCTQVLLQHGRIVPLTPEFRNAILAEVEVMTSKALRVLAMAVKWDLGELSGYTGDDSHPAHSLLADPDNYAAIERDLVFVGLTGLQDPPRPEVSEAIQNCKRAGIRVIVITGDNKNTAEAIGRQVGLFEEREDISRLCHVSSEFMQLPLDQRQDILLGPAGHGKGFVFSRAEPMHKQEIVRLLQRGGEVVAMTGDGVNDAPALKLADIGIAMGITGTEVAKEAADMVLADDDFATIVSAVREGRSIFDNMKAFIRYLISSNIGEVVSIFGNAVLGMPQGLIPVQLLWVNLVTDGAPAAALGFNPPDADIMDRKPRPAGESLISGWVFFRYMVVGAYVGLATIGVFVIWYLNADSFLGIDIHDGHTAVTFQQLTHWGECPLWPQFSAAPFHAGARTISFDNACDYFSEGKVKASTLAMSTLVVIEMFNAFNALSENNSLLSTPPWINKWLLLAVLVSMGLHVAILYTPLSDAFGVVPLSSGEWQLVVAVSAPIILVDEALKFVGRNFFSSKAVQEGGVED